MGRLLLINYLSSLCLEGPGKGKGKKKKREEEEGGDFRRRDPSIWHRRGGKKKREGKGGRGSIGDEPRIYYISVISSDAPHTEGTEKKGEGGKRKTSHTSRKLLSFIRSPERGEESRRRKGEEGCRYENLIFRLSSSRVTREGKGEREKKKEKIKRKELKPFEVSTFNNLIKIHERHEWRPGRKGRERKGRGKGEKKFPTKESITPHTIDCQFNDEEAVPLEKKGKGGGGRETDLIIRVPSLFFE